MTKPQVIRITKVYDCGKVIVVSRKEGNQFGFDNFNLLDKDICELCQWSEHCPKIKDGKD